MAARGRPLNTSFDDAIARCAGEGLGQGEIAAQLGLRSDFVHRAVHRLGLVVVDNRRRNTGRRPSDLSRASEQPIRQLAADGFTRGEIARKLGIKPYLVVNVVNRLKLIVAAAEPIIADQSRADAMAERYAAGETLAQIGSSYSITRERVRQILRDRTEVRAQDGGAAIKAKRRRAERATKQDRKYMERLGCGWDEYKRIRDLGRTMVRNGRGGDQTPLRAYCRQKYNAGRRGIGWDMSFWTWWAIWQSSGRWEQRGRGQGYVMCRRNDEGAYSPGNVFITTAIENTSSGKHKKSGLPTGVKKYGRRYEAHRQINGRKVKIGSFATPGEAYAAYVAAAPGFVPAKGVFRRAETSA